MKYLFFILLFLTANIVKAGEFNYGLNYSLGVGFVEEKEFPNYRYHSEVLGLVHFLNNKKHNENLSVNLLGLGLGLDSKSDTVVILSPVSMTYHHLSVSYNLHLEKLNYGFSLNYQF